MFIIKQVQKQGLQDQTTVNLTFDQLTENCYKSLNLFNLMK